MLFRTFALTVPTTCHIQESEDSDSIPRSRDGSWLIKPFGMVAAIGPEVVRCSSKTNEDFHPTCRMSFPLNWPRKHEAQIAIGSHLVTTRKNWPNREMMLRIRETEIIWVFDDIFDPQSYHDCNSLHFWICSYVTLAMSLIFKLIWVRFLLPATKGILKIQG